MTLVLVLGPRAQCSAGGEGISVTCAEAAQCDQQESGLWWPETQFQRCPGESKPRGRSACRGPGGKGSGEASVAHGGGRAGRTVVQDPGKAQGFPWLGELGEGAGRTGAAVHSALSTPRAWRHPRAISHPDQSHSSRVPRGCWPLRGSLGCCSHRIGELETPWGES